MRRIEGQVRGLERIIDGEYRADGLTQITAAPTAPQAWASVSSTSTSASALGMGPR